MRRTGDGRVGRLPVVALGRPLSPGALGRPGSVVSAAELLEDVRNEGPDDGDGVLDPSA